MLVPVQIDSCHATRPPSQSIALYSLSRPLSNRIRIPSYSLAISLPTHPETLAHLMPQTTIPRKITVHITYHSGFALKPTILIKKKADPSNAAGLQFRNYAKRSQCSQTPRLNSKRKAAETIQPGQEKTVSSLKQIRAEETMCP